MNEETKLILKDGTIIEGGEAGYADRTLWLWLPGMTMQEAAAILFDEEKIKKIWFRYGEMEDEYTGYTNVVTITAEENRIAAALKRRA